MCKRELATLFAHFVQETGLKSAQQGNEPWQQGLHYTTEAVCSEGGALYLQPECDYKSTNWSAAEDAWPPQDGKQYFGRGVLQLSWNYNYGQFSNIAFTEEVDDRLNLLKNPEKVITDPTLIFLSGLWFYMTPQTPKPSMHEVVTGFFKPNAVDTSLGIKATFGATTNIINPLECGSGFNQAATDRASYYASFLNYFGLPDEPDTLCESMEDFS